MSVNSATPFDEIANKIAAAQSPLKRKRGRPRKDSSASFASPTPETSSGESASPSSGATKSPSAPSATASFEIPREALKPLVQFPYAIAAKKTGFEGFLLEEETANALVPMVDSVIRQYLPTTIGPHATLITLCGTLLVVTGSKYMMYLDWRAQGRTATQAAA